MWVLEPRILSMLKYRYLFQDRCEISVYSCYLKSLFILFGVSFVTMFIRTLIPKAFFAEKSVYILFLLSNLASIVGYSGEPRYVNFTYTCYLTGIPKTANRIDVWIPVPITDDRQTVKLISVSEPDGRFTTETKYGNKIYYLQYRPGKEILGDTVKITFLYELTIQEKTVEEAKLIFLPSERSTS